MTPLAHRLMKCFTLPKRLRDNFYDKDDMIGKGLFSDFHCFEITAVQDLISDLNDKFKNEEGVDQQASIRHLSFLPAPRTWVELVDNDNGIRSAAYYVEAEDGSIDEYCIMPPEHLPEILLPTDNPEQFKRLTPENYADLGYKHAGKWHLWHIGRLDQNKFYISQYSKVPYTGVVWSVSVLAVINSPKIIMREQHQVHKGLARDLKRMHGGKFPLHAWTEIKLKVATHMVDESGERRSYLTGARAQYFCRKYVRVRFGRLEYVKAHWRGDPSIGIRRSRYTVEP